jgi:Rrf2 family iron-sulfur cluster assembly transcriptional regulator
MLSQASTYAMHALTLAASQGGKAARIKSVAEACGSPAAYLAKIMSVLARKKLVHTQRGVGGGVLLARPPEQITLHEICVALDDEVLRPRCLLGKSACTEDRSCPAHRCCRSIQQQVIEFLEQTTIAHLVAFETRLQSKP